MDNILCHAAYLKSFLTLSVCFCVDRMPVSYTDCCISGCETFQPFVAAFW